MRSQLRVLMDQGKIHRSKISTEMIERELDVATTDLDAAKASLSAGDHKWVTIQSYSSMFHAARAILYRMGYCEREDQDLLPALRELYENSVIGSILIKFSRAMKLRAEAIDKLQSSEGSAKQILEDAEEFLEETARILAAPREWFEKPYWQRIRKARKPKK